jgi:cephalosporin-C deacetylase-like acetyl esterase
MWTRCKFLLALLLMSSGMLWAQPSVQLVRVIVTADHANWQYAVGEKVNFSIQVIKNGSLVPNAKITYQVGPERMTPTLTSSVVSPTGTLQIPSQSMPSAGFLRCIATAEVDGKEYRNLATAGVAPLSLKPTVSNPADFDAFWQNAKADLAKIPMDAKMTLMPERCTEKTNVYHVNLQNYKVGTRLYGILCVPKKEGKYPAILQVPGAGVRPYGGDISNADKGYITFQIGIHGVPVTMEPSVYTDLAAGTLSGYWNYNMDDKDRFFYKRVYMGCVRANDFITSLPQFDGVNLAVIGGSQGGALSIVTAALDPRVKSLVALYPALSDVTGDLSGRAGGWPHYFEKPNRVWNETTSKLATLPYYDVVNFARRLQIPGFYTWGYNDETCPPTSMYASYNVISAPKELYLALETGHWTFPEQNEKAYGWLFSRLKP